MNKEQKEQFLEALKTLLEQKQITKEEIKVYLEEVFVKAFQRDGKYDPENPIPEANIVAEVNIDEGTFTITRTREVVETVTRENRMIHVEADEDAVIEANLKIGDNLVEEINLAEQPHGKIAHIKQLLIQKTREAEKHKLYERFASTKGELVSARVTMVHEKYVIMEYEKTSIFVPRVELSPSDRPKIGDILLVYVLEVEKESKDAQIIGSRAQVGFIEKLIERNIEDVSDGVVKIEKIAREPGFKTKVAVSSSLPEVDPVGAIIGVKGTKIQPIIDELKGERIDIIKHSNDLATFISEAVLPAKIKGTKIETNEEGQKNVIVVVEDDQFLPTIGKKGVNIKLTAILTGTKIDVKKVETAQNEGIEWGEFVYETKQFKPKQSRTPNYYDPSDEPMGVSIDDINEATKEFEIEGEDLDELYGFDEDKKEKKEKKEVVQEETKVEEEPANYNEEELDDFEEEEDEDYFDEEAYEEFEDQ